LPKLPLILGHRGSSALAPENTIAAFRQSISDGADGIEFDVRLAADNVPVVIHDASLARTASVIKSVSALTSASLRQTDVGEWFYSKRGMTRRAADDESVPTLADVFELFADQAGYLYVEMKGEPVGQELPQQVARLVEDHGFHQRVIVESFDHAAIAEIKRIDSRVRTAALFDRKIAKPLSLLRSRNIAAAAKDVAAEEIALHHSLVRPDLIKDAIARGFDVVVWTVDEAAWVSRAQGLQIKALISNNPAVLLAARDGLQA
jgi:glycerophosphoryl diester phosphodiesterase